MKYVNIPSLFLLALLTACSTDKEELFVESEALELTGLNVSVLGEAAATRTVSALSVTVGRNAFEANDTLVFTLIKRTNSPLADFTYSNIQYQYDGQSWERASNGTDSDPEKIYWTDGTSDHTFIGYNLPTENYYWVTESGDGDTKTFAGELGYGKDTIDFSDGNDSLKVEDLLVCYSDTTQAESDGLSTQLYFTHALSSVRVVVNIKNFAASSTAVDTQVGVSNMRLIDQPTLFKWGADSQDLQVLDFSEQEGHIKDIKLWCPSPDGEGTAQSKTFTFYGLTTPQNSTFHAIAGNEQYLSFAFTVTYPDPLNPSSTLTKTYQGSFSSLVNFNSGDCTTLNISLNHKDEQMYTEVSYTDWNFVSTPDLGELRKKSTFMDIDSEVSIHTDSYATVDDATWLYVDSTNQLLDIYGNDGTSDNPYRITSASQLLSMAKEVQSGWTFEGQYIRLDADITMQSSSSKTNVEDTTSTLSPVEWIGIGNATYAFQGTFWGGDRYINRLCGSPLFVQLGEKACVEQLYITSIGSISGGGTLADSNAGIVADCKVIDAVSTTGGALLGTNTGTVYASYHTGETQLVSSNSGTLAGCYIASDVIALTDLALSTLVGTLNQELDSLYSTNASLTQYQYTYTIGSYPTVEEK